MKSYLVMLLLAIVIGFGAAMAMNQRVYGYREGKFGAMTSDGSVMAENVIKTISKSSDKGFGRVAMPEGKEFEFGIMSPNDKGEHLFKIRNIGTSALKLDVGHTTCKCTLGSLKTDTLAPGEETEIKLEWTVKTSEETFSQSAEIITDDPTQNFVRLRIFGRVVRNIEMSPKEWTVGEVAAGEPFDYEATVYSFMKHDIEPADMKFSDDALNKLAKFEVSTYEPTEAVDGVHAKARQAFKVKVHVDAGLKQGPFSPSFKFGYYHLDDQGERVAELDAAAGTDQAVASEQAAANEHTTGNEANTASVSDAEQHPYLEAAVTGRVVGALSMITGSHLTGVKGSGYVYDFGKLSEGDSLKAKALVVLKGNQRDNTTLSIGKIEPAGVIQAKLVKGTARNTMILHTLELELIPGAEPIERLGLNKTDFGQVWIESDNPKVPALRLMIKFALPGKS